MRYKAAGSILAWMAAGACLVGVARAGTQITGCTQTPKTDPDNVVQEGQSFSLSCSFSGDHVKSCTWYHYSPTIDNPNENSDHKLADCTFSDGQNSNPGTSDCNNRFSGSTSASSCQLTVTNTNNEDSGVWKMVAFGASDNQASTPNRDFKVFTFNRTQIEIKDQDQNPVSTIQTSYNWNDREEDWEEGKGGYESIQLSCQAFGARPNPVFKWYVGNRMGAPLSDGNIFAIRNGNTIRSYGRDGIIRDTESTINFNVNKDLLDYLETQNVITNPEQGNFNFDLTCQVDQSGGGGGGGGGNNNHGGGGNYQGPQTVTFQVQKSYDNGGLKSSTIGIIVGVVCAVVLLIIALGLLLFARSRNMWCFDDYEDANNPKSRPQQGGIQTGPRQSAQGPRQYR